jgi:hypothetical protein
MKSKLAVTLLFAALAASAPGALTVGDYINIDYGNRAGTVGTGVSYAGAVNTGEWNTTNGGFSSWTSTKVNSTGGSVSFGTYSGGQTSGSAGHYGNTAAAGINLVGQDYVYVNNSGAGDVTLNGNSVGSYLRFTIYTPTAESNGFAVGQSWNITFSGGGDAVGQGLNLDVNDGGTIVQATLPGPTAVGTSWSGYVDGETYTTLNGINPTVNGSNTEIEFWMWTPAGSTGNAANSAISGIQMQLVAIPEPSAISLLGLGALGLAVRRRR